MKYLALFDNFFYYFPRIPEVILPLKRTNSSPACLKCMLPEVWRHDISVFSLSLFLFFFFFFFFLTESQLLQKHRSCPLGVILSRGYRSRRGNIVCYQNFQVFSFPLANNCECSVLAHRHFFPSLL